ncbi:unnamed protein product [Nesidiocoris tenuis]|uniref:Uncharacterized protein n=1 Tax=Nesidiocoris tenuis TaxID=355587 RepID=A0A6H5H675_9HEMI|nr:unnamed protein product [Nesidiocoris tenuis]
MDEEQNMQHILLRCRHTTSMLHPICMKHSSPRKNPAKKPEHDLSDSENSSRSAPPSKSSSPSSSKNNSPSKSSTSSRGSHSSPKAKHDSRSSKKEPKRTFSRIKTFSEKSKRKRIQPPSSGSESNSSRSSSSDRSRLGDRKTKKRRKLKRDRRSPVIFYGRHRNVLPDRREQRGREENVQNHAAGVCRVRRGSHAQEHEHGPLRALVQHQREVPAPPHGYATAEQSSRTDVPAELRHAEHVLVEDRVHQEFLRQEAEEFIAEVRRFRAGTARPGQADYEAVCHAAPQTGRPQGPAQEDERCPESAHGERAEDQVRRLPGGAPRNSEEPEPRQSGEFHVQFYAVEETLQPSAYSSLQLQALESFCMVYRIIGKLASLTDSQVITLCFFFIERRLTRQIDDISSRKFIIKVRCTSEDNGAQIGESAFGSDSGLPIRFGRKTPVCCQMVSWKSRILQIRTPGEPVHGRIPSTRTRRRCMSRHYQPLD